MIVELFNKKIGSTRAFYNVHELKEFLKHRKDIVISYDERQELEDLLCYKDEFIKEAEIIEGTFYEIQVWKN